MAEKRREGLTPFAARLEQYRWENHFGTVAALATHLGMPRATVNAWFASGRQPRPAVIMHVARKTSIPAEELFKLAGYDTMPDVPLDPWEFLEKAAKDSGTRAWIREQHDKWEMASGQGLAVEARC